MHMYSKKNVTFNFIMGKSKRAPPVLKSEVCQIQSVKRLNLKSVLNLYMNCMNYELVVCIV